MLKDAMFTLGLLALVVVCFVAAILLGWFSSFSDLAKSAYFSPRQEQVRRATFEQSQAYVEGQRRDIDNLRLEWIDATPAKRAAIRSIALMRIAALPYDMLTPSIVGFRNELQQGE